MPSEPTHAARLRLPRILLSILYLRCNGWRLHDFIDKTVDSFNSLFEMKPVAVPLPTREMLAFNSLFEMPQRFRWCYRHLKLQPFNSLFEMPTSRAKNGSHENRRLSILYLRCGGRRAEALASLHAATFNSLFEMPLLQAR